MVSSCTIFCICLAFPQSVNRCSPLQVHQVQENLVAVNGQLCKSHPFPKNESIERKILYCSDQNVYCNWEIGSSNQQKACKSTVAVDDCLSH